PRSPPSPCFPSTTLFRSCPRCQGDLSRPFPLPGQHPPPPQQGQPRPVVTGTAAQRLQSEWQYSRRPPEQAPHGQGAHSQGPHGQPPQGRDPERPPRHDPRQGAPRRRAALPRGYRWVARPPSGTRAARTEARPHGPEDLGPTPRYRQIPRWGLHVEPPSPDTERDAKDRSAAASARTVLTSTIVLFALAALAEVFRYALMLRNRGHLVHQLTVAISDATALVFGYAAMAFVVVSAIVCARWLV